jgi:alkanesulfonate monooxygenase SsuD/methylene tetrahydromethanopterin reductase-like flavin-dependent oxidoreductase (luciferase family)
MELGANFPTYCTGERQVLTETLEWWAKEVENAGFVGLWSLDHLVTPHTYTTSVLDPVVSLTYAAAVTEDLDVGTSILLLPLRRTGAIASAILSLQYLAGGDVTIGAGAGYVPEEFEVTGVPIKERGPRLKEGVEVLQRLFGGEASFSGRFHDFEDIQIDPVLDDPPRVLAGGSSSLGRLDKDADDSDADPEPTFPEPILARILNADGWIAPPTNPEKTAHEWEQIREYAQSHGVDPDSIDLTIFNYVHVVNDDDPDVVRSRQRAAFEELFSESRGFEDAERNCLTGTVDEIVDDLRTYEEIGFDEAIVGAVVNDPDEIRTQMRLFREKFLPHFE